MRLPKPPFVLLDDSKSKGRADAGLLFSSPARILTARKVSEIPLLLADIERYQNEGKYLAGWIAYEAGLAFHPTLSKKRPRLSDEPLAWIGVFGPPSVLSSGDLAAFPNSNAPCANSLSLAPSESREKFRKAFKTIQDYIRAGDVYQINHTFRLLAEHRGSPLGLYADLRRAQPVPYGAFIDTGEWRVLSLSPELFLKRHGDQLISRPMKGTGPVGRNWHELLGNREALERDPKNRAENLMITDLIRNDMARVAKPGTVRVDKPFNVERFGKVLQMTSEIRGRLAGRPGFSDIFKALFPCGSITGAPKVRAMEIIAETESAPRGVYTGAIGYWAPGGDFTLNIPIRTLVLGANGRGGFGIGSGIVADSTEEGEYEECLLKGGFLSERPRPFALIETMAWRRGRGFEFLDYHLERMAASAKYFDFPFDEKDARKTLSVSAYAKTKRARLRVRLMSDANGNLSLEQRPLKAPPRCPVLVAVAAGRVCSSDPFLFHKTTRREVFEDALGKVPKNKGPLYDVLFLNQENEVTEGSFNNVFLPVEGGLLATPPLKCGVLPGVLRRHLLTTGRAVERPIRPKDLKAAREFFIGNSVTGLIPARFV